MRINYKVTENKWGVLVKLLTNTVKMFVSYCLLESYFAAFNPQSTYNFVHYHDSFKMIQITKSQNKSIWSGMSFVTFKWDGSTYDAQIYRYYLFTQYFFFYNVVQYFQLRLFRSQKLEKSCLQRYLFYFPPKAFSLPIIFIFTNNCLKRHK